MLVAEPRAGIHKLRSRRRSGLAVLFRFRPRSAYSVANASAAGGAKLAVWNAVACPSASTMCCSMARSLIGSAIAHDARESAKPGSRQIPSVEVGKHSARRTFKVSPSQAGEGSRTRPHRLMLRPLPIIRVAHGQVSCRSAQSFSSRDYRLAAADDDDDRHQPAATV